MAETNRESILEQYADQRNLAARQRGADQTADVALCRVSTVIREEGVFTVDTASGCFVCS